MLRMCQFSQQFDLAKLVQIQLAIRRPFELGLGGNLNRRFWEKVSNIWEHPGQMMSHFGSHN